MAIKEGLYKKMVQDGKTSLEVSKRSGGEWVLDCPEEGWKSIGLVDKTGERFFGAFSYRDGTCGFHVVSAIAAGLHMRGGYDLGQEWETLWYEAARLPDSEEGDLSRLADNVNPLLTDMGDGGSTPVGVACETGEKG